MTGCVSKPPTLYHWGQYEQLLYSSYKKPGELSPQAQINILNDDLIKAQAAGQDVPPGVYGQLGYLYFSTGDFTAAEKALNMEKQLFPESAHFIDGLIANASSEQDAQ